METSISIPRAEFDARCDGLREYLSREGLAGVVLFDNYYILYFSGFAFIPTERPIAFLMNARGEKTLFAPFLEAEHARADTGFDRIEHYVEYPSSTHPMQVLKKLLQDMGITSRIGADQDGYPWILGYRGPALSELTGAQIDRVADFVEESMMLKSPGEIALIRESIKWSNLAHRLLQRYTHAGVTETEVSLRASHEAALTMLDALGGLYRAQSPFESGPSAGYRGQIGRNAAIPHSLANNIVFQTGDVLVSGASTPMWGYNSELERTMIIGRPSDEQCRMFEHMKNAQDVAMGELRPGARCADVDRAVRAYYENNGLMPYCNHHSGHSIGLRYHEGPFLDLGDQTVIQPGMVFTVEPGLYERELGGFRHSDTVLITENGMERMTYYPRELESLIILP